MPSIPNNLTSTISASSTRLAEEQVEVYRNIASRAVEVAQDLHSERDEYREEAERLREQERVRLERQVILLPFTRHKELG